MSIGDGRCSNCGEDEMDGARCYYCGFHEYSCDMPDCTWCSDASDAALINDICDKMAEVVAPLPGIPDAPGQHAGTRAIEPSDGDEA